MAKNKPEDKKDYGVHEIINQDYRFVQTLPNIGEAYLIVVETDGIAAIQHFGEKEQPHKKIADIYTGDGFTVRCVYTAGNILQLAELRDTWNKKPIDKVISELERELLKL